MKEFLKESTNTDNNFKWFVTSVKLKDWYSMKTNWLWTRFFLTLICSLFPVWHLQLIENSMCLLRNLSYQVHREIPGCERFQEALPLNQGPAPSGQKGGCFSSRKSKGLCRGRSVACVCVRWAVGRRVGLHQRQCLAVAKLVRAHKRGDVHKQNASLSEECQQFPPSSEMAHPLRRCSLFVFHREYWFVILRYSLCLQHMTTSI